MLTNGSFVNCGHFKLSWTRPCFPMSCPMVCSVMAGDVKWFSARIPAAAADPPDISDQGDLQASPSSLYRFCMQVCLVFIRAIGVRTHAGMAVRHQAISGLLSCGILLSSVCPEPLSSLQPGSSNNTYAIHPGQYNLISFTSSAGL